MESDHPTIYFDFGSPYGYLAVERATGVFGFPVALAPILLGAIFKRRGSGSWAETAEREARVAEIEQRARRYGLPPIVWPALWPATSLAANRAAIWAATEDALSPFAHALYRRQFTQGADITDTAVLAGAAAEAGLDARALGEALQRQDIKDALREATDAAWELGVRGVPTTVVNGVAFYGDDKLEEAAAFLSRRSAQSATGASGGA